MMPDPSPTLVSIRTTEGPTSWTSLTYSDCNLNDDDGVLAAGLAVVAPQAASSTATMAATTIPMPRPGTLVTFDISSSRASLDVFQQGPHFCFAYYRFSAGVSDKTPLIGGIGGRYPTGLEGPPRE